MAVSNSLLFGRWYAKVSCEMNGGCGAAVKIEAHNAKTAKRRATEVWNMIAGLVKHGRWVTLTECANEGVYCSECHKKVYKADYAWSNRGNKVRSNYCPNCGARMDGDGNV